MGDEATDFNLTEKALKTSNIRLYGLARLFHPKVIHFEGHGVYIGSADLTDTALHKNVEAGVFRPEAELGANKLNYLDTFFG